MMKLVVPAVVVVLLAVGCGGSDTSPPDLDQRVLVYLLRGEAVGAVAREAPSSAALERTVVEELLAGPTEEELQAGLGTAITEGTELLDVDVEDGIATVDLSGEFDDGGGSASMFTRLAQVVFTLTRLDAVEGVVFRIDGAPVTSFSSEGIVLDGPQGRDEYEAQSPAILVESPALNDAVASPLRLAGTANTFEATLAYELVAADGSVLADGFTTATCGTGCRGTFDVQVSFDPGDATAVTLTVWEPSAEDGSRTKVVTIPLAVA